MKSKGKKESIHIGQRIRKEIDRQAYDITQLADEIGCCRTNIYKICSREDLDTSTLMKLSIALHYNFFRELSDVADNYIK